MIDVKEQFGQQIKKVTNECLWRIKDAEELIKSRVSQISLDNSIKDFKEHFRNDLKSKTDSINHKIEDVS